MYFKPITEMKTQTCKSGTDKIWNRPIQVSIDSSFTHFLFMNSFIFRLPKNKAREHEKTPCVAIHMINFVQQCHILNPY